MVAAKSPAMNMCHLANALQMLTILACIVVKSSDPDGHSQWLMRGLMKNKVLSIPGYPQPVPKPPRNEKAYIVKLTPMMGRDVFTTHNIPRDKIIFAEWPLLIMPVGIVPQVMVAAGSECNLGDYIKMAMLEQERYLEVALGRMEPDNRAKFMALVNCHLEDRYGILNGMVRKNGYS